MTLYEAMFARRSVRQYDKAPLGEEALDEIKKYVGDLKQIGAHQARFEFADGGAVKGGFAPHAILAFADDSDEALVNIGYTLQGADLWLQSKGYGSIWCGMASPREAGSDYRILLGFGNTAVPLRAGENDFKRKKLSDISDENNAIARAARIAPSAVNFQPWKLSFSDGRVTVKSNTRGIARILPGRLYLVDLGIVARHVTTALGHEGRAVTAINIKGNGKDSSVEVGYE
jgi:hypothetical protein